MEYKSIWKKTMQITAVCLAVVLLTGVSGMMGNSKTGNAKENTKENTTLSDRSKEAQQLYQYLEECSGKVTISGQHSNKGSYGPEFQAVRKVTGKTPAILGCDFIYLSSVYAAHGEPSDAVKNAEDFHARGGIVTFCWHWCAPQKYLYDTAEEPWYKGFYTEGTNIDLAKIMNGEDPEGLSLLDADIDIIAAALKELQDARIPVLWRPLHEASGGWFWWGAAGPDAYKKLYIHLYDRLTKEYGLDNLIWVWNGQDPEWYPGDAYVDIMGDDIYPDKHDYSAHEDRYDIIESSTPEHKMIAMTENGVIPDPDTMTDAKRWLYFMTWENEFTVAANSSVIIKYSPEYTDEEMLNKVYNSDKVITLDELPDFGTN